MLRTLRHWYEIGYETVGRYRAGEIAPYTHPHSTAYTHGELGILAHKHEIRSKRILKMTELIIIKIFDDFFHRIDTGVRSIPKLNNLVRLFHIRIPDLLARQAVKRQSIDRRSH